MDILVEELLKKKTLLKKELFDLVEMHGCFEPDPPSILDIRAEKRKQFQQVVTNQKAVIASNV